MLIVLWVSVNGRIPSSQVTSRRARPEPHVELAEDRDSAAGRKCPVMSALANGAESVARLRQATCGLFAS